MTTLKEMQEFTKMWTWLSSHPAHSQEYYMRHVARLQSFWEKSCPLCHVAEGACKNCEIFWSSKKGNLCTDMDSPLNRWRQTSVNDPDNRTYLASRVAALSHRALRKMQKGHA